MYYSQESLGLEVGGLAPGALDICPNGSHESHSQQPKSWRQHRTQSRIRESPPPCLL